MKHRFVSKDHAFIFHLFTPKIDKIAQPDSSATQFIQQLGFVGSLVNRIGFQLYNYSVSHEQISGVITHNDALVLNLYFWLKLHFYAARLKFSLHGALINLFEKPKAENIMDFKCGTDELLRHRLE